MTRDLLCTAFGYFFFGKFSSLCQTARARPLLPGPFFLTLSLSTAPSLYAPQSLLASWRLFPPGRQHKNTDVSAESADRDTRRQKCAEEERGHLFLFLFQKESQVWRILSKILISLSSLHCYQDLLLFRREIIRLLLSFRTSCRAKT